MFVVDTMSGGRVATRCERSHWTPLLDTAIGGTAKGSAVSVSCHLWIRSARQLSADADGGVS